MPDYRRARTGSVYFFTVVTFNRAPIFCSDVSRDALRDAIAEAKAKRPFMIKAWVLMPDHLHCIWELPSEDNDYSVRWAIIKKGFTKRMRGALSCPAPSLSRSKHREATIWQRRFWEHCIRDEDDYQRHCDYIHYNPVKHGHVASALAWPYSTFHRFVAEGIYTPDWGKGVEPSLEACGE